MRGIEEWHADCCQRLMSKAPGYQSKPNHRIRESSVAETVSVSVRGQTLAESGDVLRVDEDGHPVRYYFPRLAVRTDLLERSQTVTRCPFKGAATYFTLDIGGQKLVDAVWSYEDPYEEHRGLKDRLAFYEEKFPELEIRVGG